MTTILFLAWGLSPAADPAAYVTYRTGTSPIILSAPHGGTLPVPGVGVRTGFAVAQFVTVRDTGSDDVALAVAKALETKTGRGPHLVVAKFARTYIDANRPADDAYEWKAAAPVYAVYHKALADAKATVAKDWGRGLLLDLHGQGADPNAIFRGTNDGKSVTHLTDRFGRAGLTGPSGVLGGLERAGYKVVPAGDSKDKEDPRYGGGYITRTYGSRDGGTVDAIQLELGTSMRSAAKRERFARDLADAVIVYAKEYLPEKPKAGP
jgi:N-formylglutamate amidohydrolase